MFIWVLYNLFLIPTLSIFSSRIIDTKSIIIDNSEFVNLWIFVNTVRGFFNTFVLHLILLLQNTEDKHLCSKTSLSENPHNDTMQYNIAFL